ncbi:MAG: 1,4-alpha-glucan branching protein domain-containing protein [Gemmatimonadales bacterium]|jgi:1,4-alpha-glucan branching enzyme
MDFVLGLHSHLPWVLHHGRWPHGSDWLCEAALDTYLPLLEALHGLASRRVPAPVTIGFTPVLAAQLAHPDFAAELAAFLAQRILACGEARQTLPQTGEAHLLPLVDYWEARFRRLRALFEAEDHDLPGAFAVLEDCGRLEIITSAATHGFLPLLARDESIRLQLAMGLAEHRRLFGRDPAGVWLPECAYRPRGFWAPLPDVPRPGVRAGIEEFLAEQGLQFFFTDAHLAQAGNALGGYAEIPLGAERFGAERQDAGRYRAEAPVRSPYRAYRVASAGGRGTAAALVRDPRSSMQVWSRQEGYPGDEAYLEFHKIRWPGGLKLWRVSWPGADLGAKQPYDPGAALARASLHASHFVSVLAGLADGVGGAGGAAGAVVAAPFDTELFGHWWFEGVDFLAAMYRGLAGQQAVRPATASQHLAEWPPASTVQLMEGTWGAGGDDSMWLNDGTAWTWRRMWPLEDRFWRVARAALGLPGAQPVLAQATRELLLAQASDWQFIISTGAVTDYGERRFALHCDDAERLVGGLEAAVAGGDLGGVTRFAEDLRRRDDCFPEVFTALAGVLRMGGEPGRG